MTRLHRSLLSVLLVLVGGNIAGSVWYAEKLESTAAAQVIQKAYVVSRLLSDAGARSLQTHKPAIIEEAIAEALKDRHLAAVTINGAMGETLIASADADHQGKLNSFETPILANGKHLGTVVIRFRYDSDGDRLATLLKRSALLQTVILALMALWYAITIWNRRQQRPVCAQTRADSAAPLLLPLPAHRSPVVTVSSLPGWQPASASVAAAGTVPLPATLQRLLPTLPPVPARSLPEPPAAFAAPGASPPEAATPTTAPSPPATERLLRQAAAASKALDTLRHLISRQEESRRRTSRFEERTADWSSACRSASRQTGTLVTSAMEIVSAVLQECRLGTTAAGEPAMAELASGLQRAIADLRSAAPAAASGSLSPTPEPTDDADLFRQLARMLHRDALPDLLTVREDADSCNRIAADLGGFLADLERQSRALLDGCEELFETARLVEEEEDCSETAAGTGARATTLQATAEAHGERILALRREIERATYLQSQMTSALGRLVPTVNRAGTVVTDAATAALQGEAILSRLQETAAGREATAGSVADDLERLDEQLARLPYLSRRPEEAAASLLVAAETLQMAMSILRELAATYPEAVTRDDLLPLAADEAATQLIGEAQLAVSQLLLSLADDTAEHGQPGTVANVRGCP